MVPKNFRRRIGIGTGGKALGECETDGAFGCDVLNRPVAPALAMT
jgi:hypothetical protein